MYQGSEKQKGVIRQLCLYNPDLTFQENMRILGVKQYKSLRDLVLRYKLPKYTNVKVAKNYQRLWDETKSISENAERLGINYGCANSVKARFKFAAKRYKQHTKTRAKCNRLEVIFLRNRGYTWDSIARLFGVTRQCVHSLFNSSVSLLPKEALLRKEGTA